MRLNSEVKISAAVWGSYPDTIDSIGQDWGYWLKKNYVDFVCPMNYTRDNSEFRKLIQDQIKFTKAPARIYPGMGVTSDESQLGADQVIEQINILRNLKTGGFMLFDMSHTLRLDTLPTLSLGITRK